MAVIKESRQERRKNYDPTIRMALLEDDADTAEARQERVEGKLDQIRTWLVTGAITFAFSAILLGINIALTLRGG